MGPGSGNVGKLGDLLSGVRLPDMKISGGSSAGGSTARSASSETASAPGESGSLSTILLIVGGLLLAGFFLWKKAKPDEADDKQIVHAALRGEWDPRQVASRDDVVKIFDRLSLARLGSDAANWHHRQIGERLATESPVPKPAIERLVSLYEKARYAPGRDIFSDAEISEARQGLCDMAGLERPA
jgi:hypothetical protein